MTSRLLQRNRLFRRYQQKPALHRAVAPGRLRSRLVAMDLVAAGDVLGCLCGGMVSSYVAYGRGCDFPTIQTVQVWLLTSFFCHLGLRHGGFYEPKSVKDLSLRSTTTVAALMVAMAMTYGLGLPRGQYGDHVPAWYSVWMLVAFIAISANRRLARNHLLRMTCKGTFQARIAIYGAGALAEHVIAAISKRHHDAVFVGSFDDRVDASRQPSRGPECLGSIEDLIALGRSGEIDQVIIALPETAERRIAEVTRRLEQLPASLHIATHFSGEFLDVRATHHVSALGNVGLIDIKKKPMADWGCYVKIAEDYIIASITLIAALPVMLLIAIAIKCDSPGPVFFRQRRHGLNRRVINVMKFRSMTVSEDDATVVQAKRYGDARVTRVGAFLRRSSLDELPQLFNVLRGEMSLIGPRPHALLHDDQYAEQVERYANRHQVKPGMTGWAQVNGFRGPTETIDNMRHRIACDLAYIDRWSLWFDMRILVLTVFVGFRHKNAV
jgi:Undecaprenyl-phosphate glucose phosphotransferase